MLETKKYVLTVEGETEQWYFNWLKDQINHCEDRKYNVAIIAKVQQSPRSFYKGVNSKKEHLEALTQALILYYLQCHIKFKYT